MPKPMSVKTIVAGPSTLTVTFPAVSSLNEEQAERIRTSVRQLAGLGEDELMKMATRLRSRGYTFARNSNAACIVSNVFAEILRRNQVQFEYDACDVNGVNQITIVRSGSTIAVVTGRNSPMVFDIARRFRDGTIGKELLENVTVADDGTATTIESPIEVDIDA